MRKHELGVGNKDPPDDCPERFEAEVPRTLKSVMLATMVAFFAPHRGRRATEIETRKRSLVRLNELYAMMEWKG